MMSKINCQAQEVHEPETSRTFELKHTPVNQIKVIYGLVKAVGTEYEIGTKYNDFRINYTLITLPFNAVEKAFYVEYEYELSESEIGDEYKTATKVFLDWLDFKDYKENKNLRNEILERWYEKNLAAINQAAMSKTNDIIEQDPLVIRVKTDLDEINSYIKKDLNIYQDLLIFDEQMIITEDTQTKLDECDVQKYKCIARLKDEKEDIYALLTLAASSSGEYMPIEILKTQEVLHDNLDIDVRSYEFSFKQPN